MKALKIIGIVLGALVVILAIAVTMQPNQGKVEKSIVINASPSIVFNDLNSFKSFKKWSPWAKMDPDAQYTFEGPETGVGAKMNWKGEKVGSGSQWIEESVENQRIKCGLQFEGYDGKAFAEFIFTPEGEGTRVTWTYEGSNDGIAGKAMWLVMGSMLSGQYEQGLTDMKSYIESLPAPADSTANP